MDAAKKYCYIGSKGNPDVYYNMNRGGDREDIADLENGNLVEFRRDVSVPGLANSARAVAMAFFILLLHGCVMLGTPGPNESFRLADFVTSWFGTKGC